MKTLFAFIAADGSLHRTTTDAALAELAALGLPRDAAWTIIKNRHAVADTLASLAEPQTIPRYDNFAPVLINGGAA